MQRHAAQLALGIVPAGGGEELFALAVLVLAAYAEHVLFIAVVIALGEAVAGKGGLERVQLVLRRRAALVQDLGVDARDQGGIFGTLHAALDLETGDAGVLELGELVHKAVVLEGKGIVVHPAAEGVGHAAGLGAHAAVAAPAADQRGHIALPAVAEAQRAVDEDLGLDGSAGGDVTDLIDRQLAREHGARESHLGRGLDPGEIVDAHLRAGVQGNVRQRGAQRAHEPEILHDQSVGAERGDEPRLGDGRFRFTVVHERVERDIDPAAADAAVAHGLLKLFLGKVFRSAAGVEVAQTEIDRVGAVLYGGNDGFRRAGGGKQFCHGFSFGAEDRLFRIKSIKIQNTLYHKSPSCDKN